MPAPFEYARFAGTGACWSKDGSTLSVYDDRFRCSLVDMSSGQSRETANLWGREEPDLLKMFERFPPLPPFQAFWDENRRAREPELKKRWFMVSADRRVRVRLEWDLITVTDQADQTHIAELPVDFNPAWVFSNERVPLPVLSSDGQWLACQDSYSTFKVIRLVAGAKPTTIKREGQRPCLAISPDGKILAVGTSSGLELFDTANGNQLKHIVQGEPCTSVTFSPDGKTLAASIAVPGGEEMHGAVRLWDLVSWQNEVSIPIHNAKVLSLAFSPDCRYLAAGHFRWSNPRMEVSIWDLARQQQMRGAR
jgi:WD40 repeat protein